MLKYFLLLFILPLLLIPIFAQEYSDNTSTSIISVQTADNHYDENDTIVISGMVTTVMGETPVTLQLFTEGNLIDIVQITVAQDGSYSHTVIAEGPLWKKVGMCIVRASYGEGNIAESEFSYTPKSELIETTANFEVSAGSSGTFDVKYTITGGILKDMIVDLDNFAIIMQIESIDDGVISLDLPREFIGAEKQNDKDDTFIILIDGIEVAYQESVVHSDYRIITINFESGDSDIEVIGTYVLGGNYSVKTDSLTITTDQSTYHEDNSIYISGNLNNSHNGPSINISLQSPKGHLSHIPNVITLNNSYNIKIPTGNNTSITTPGIYTLTAHYGTETATTTFDYYLNSTDTQEAYFIPDEQYLILSDHSITKWNNELTKWQNAQNRTDNKIEFYYEKLDKAISRNQTNQIELFTERIGHSIALSSLYDGMIKCLEEQLELLS